MALRVGIVGASWGAFAHLPAWRAIPGIEVTAICTSRAETAKAAQHRLGLLRAFWDADAMCADPDIDIVDLGTRPSVRLPMILAALKAGKHIYNASPHAPDWAGAKAIDAAWTGSNSIGVVDAFSEYIPALAQMKAMLDSGYLGAALGGTCHFNLGLFNAPDKQFPYNWFADSSAGVSALRNNGSHVLYLLTHMFGPVAELVADDSQILSQWVFPDGDFISPETTDFANIILKFERGLTMQLQISWSMPLHDGFFIDVFGEKARLLAKSPTFPTSVECTLEAGRLGGHLAPVVIPESYKSVDAIDLDWQAEIQPSFPMALSMHAMVEAIHGSNNASPDFSRALEIECLQEAMRVSSRERRWIKLREIH